MTARPLWRALCLLALLCTWSRTSSADTQPDPSAAEQEVTLSHIYKIDIPGSLQMETTKTGNNDIIFRHNIKLQPPRCDCEESESFKSLLYRVNGLEEEVNYLKTQCAQGCCGAAGVDKSCSGHGTYQHDTCSCLCNIGWEGPDCSESSCPDECNDNGRCVDGQCVCYEGYTGEDCSELTCPDNCNDNGRCVDGQCVCYEGYTGEDCSELTCPGNCSDNGRCVDGQCVCYEGYTGEDCILAPQGLEVVQVTDVSLLVEWESVQGAEYYVLTYYPKNDEGAQEQISVANTENSYLITGLTPGVTYIVQVHAVIKEIQSEADEIEATTDVSTIDGIRVLGQTEVSIEVDWQNPQAEMDYFRLTHTDPEGQEEELKVQRSQEARTKHTIVGLYPGTEYVISVQAIKGNNGGKASSVTGATDIDAPTNLVTTEVTEDTATVSWDQAQAEIEGYMLSYTSAEGSSSDISVARDSTSYRLIGLRPGVLHTVYIWAYKGDKVSGKSSTEAETDLDAPTNVFAQDETEFSFRVHWDPPQAEIDGYMLTYSSSEGSSEEITVEKQLVAGESSFAASSLEMGKRYIVTIIAYRGNKRSKVVETIFKTVGLLYPFPMDCVQIMKNGNKRNGVYTVYINNDRSKPIEAYCDMDTDGGGWLVLQRRNIGKLDFMKRWRQYIAGFGNLTEEFWIGLDKIHELTNTPTQYELRVDLGVGSERAYAVYDNFKIAPVKQKFKLTIGKYSGTAGDAMTYHQGLPWTTIDSDNDLALTNCALSHRGAWWYKNCHLANLNGKWGETRHSMGVNWEPWKGHLTSLDFTEMKIRPVGALSSRKRRSLAAREKSRNAKLQKK
uniref:Tenascin N n=1 Tax=Oreochromis niloticus TaxID=8128 RepID=A0A669ECL9_ORENI